MKSMLTVYDKYEEDNGDKLHQVQTHSVGEILIGNVKNAKNWKVFSRFALNFRCYSR